jgi:tetratricopeptide (TPR) repeat protein
MNFRLAALIPVLASSSLTAANAQEAEQPFQAAALLIKEDGTFERAWIVASTKTAIRYRDGEFADATTDAKISDFKSIYLFEPREYSAAMNLYQARKYDEAKERFSKIKERFKPVASLDNSPGTLAAFYEMECLRKLGDLEGLAAALQQFDKSPLTRESQLRQIELYVIWDAVRTSNWQGVEKLAQDRAKSRLPGDQRAQVAYCHGLALEGLKRPDEALLAYQTAITADGGSASEEIARQSALRIMAILMDHPDVPRAVRAWGTPQENKNTPGYSRLTEAAIMATLYQKNLGAGTPLPDEFKDLPKYRPKEEPAAAEEQKATN